MAQSPTERENQFRGMRDSARQIFQHALADASIDKAFQRHVSCERGVLRIREDLYDLHSYSRVFVVSMGKAGHTMAQALEGGPCHVVCGRGPLLRMAVLVDWFGWYSLPCAQEVLRRKVLSRAKC